MFVATRLRRLPGVRRLDTALVSKRRDRYQSGVKPPHSREAPKLNHRYNVTTNKELLMPKISDIEETPNPNAVKFILREAVSNGVARQYGSADLAENDPLAKSLFDVGHVVSVFYMDKMITVEKDDEGDWDELLPTLAVPIRAAEAVSSAAAAAAAAVGGSIAAVASDDPRLLKI